MLYRTVDAVSAGPTATWHWCTHAVSPRISVMISIGLIASVYKLRLSDCNHCLLLDAPKGFVRPQGGRGGRILYPELKLRSESLRPPTETELIQCATYAAGRDTGHERAFYSALRTASISLTIGALCWGVQLNRIWGNSQSVRRTTGIHYSKPPMSLTPVGYRTGPRFRNRSKQCHWFVSRLSRVAPCCQLLDW